MRKGWLICTVPFSQALCSYQSGFAALKGDISLFQPTSGLASSVYAYYDHNDGEYHDARIGINQNAHFVVIDPSTVYLGYVIKKVGDSGGPAYYRIA